MSILPYKKEVVKMKNTYSIILLTASLLVAVNTSWCKTSKIFVFFSAALLIISALKGLITHESESDTT